jgi:hypothetical protein
VSQFATESLLVSVCAIRLAVSIRNGSSEFLLRQMVWQLLTQSIRSSSHRRIRGLDQEAARISGRRNSCSRTSTDDLKSAGPCDASAGLAVLHALRAQFVQAAECAERHRRALPAASRHHCSTPAPHSTVARFSEADEFAWMTCMFPSSRVLCRCDTSSCFPGLRF